MITHIGIKIESCGCGCNKTVASLVDADGNDLHTIIAVVASGPFQDSPEVKRLFEQLCHEIIRHGVEKAGCVAGRPVRVTEGDRN